MLYTLWNVQTGKFLTGIGSWREGEPSETFTLRVCREWKKEKYSKRPEIQIVRWKMVPVPVES